MVFIIALAVVIIFYAFRKQLNAFVGWVLGKFTAIPIAFTGSVVPALVRVVTLNWYTFLMIFLLWFLLFRVAVGKDIINAYLFNLQEIDGLARMLPLLMLFGCILLMSLAIWLIPFYLYSEKTREENTATEEKAKRFYIGTKLLAFVAMLPFLVVTNAFIGFLDLLPKAGIWGTLLINAVSFVVFLFMSYVFQRSGPVKWKGPIGQFTNWVKTHVSNPYLFILLRIAFWILILLVVTFSIRLPGKSEALVVAIFIFIGSVIVFRLLFFTSGSNAVVPLYEVTSMQSDENRRNSKALYLGTFFFLALITFYYYLVPSLEATNPLYILLIVFSLFIIYLDFWRNIFRNRTGFMRIAAVAANLLFLALPFITRHDQFRIPMAENQALPAQRVKLDSALRARLSYMDKKDSGGSKYIICAMGGGSRAGYIAAGVLKRLEELQPGFWDHTLCYSTVSGGSVGTYHYILGKETGHTKDSNYLRYLYQKNYNGSGVFGLLIGDALETLFGRAVSVPKGWVAGLQPAYGFFDRDYRIRQEYDYVLDQAMSGDTNGGYLKKTFYPFYANALPKDKFAGYYLEKKDSIPIQLVNTFEINSGRRTVLSPFPAKDTNFFINAILPLQDKNYSDNPLKKDLSYREAVNLSELFPFISAASHIGISPSLFVDGGYFENYGLATALDVYTYIQDSLSRYKQQVKIILVKNSNQDPELPGQQLQLLAPLIGALHSPFTGHANHIMGETKRVMDSVHFFRIVFDGDGHNVPLTRSFSKSHIEAMDSFINRLDIYPGLVPFLHKK